jgi:glycosyltransferase involved in cell wall biosynthesis
MLELSVILCVHNPRGDYFERVLQALHNQTLSKDSWELLLIDNASHVPLASTWDLSWHPHAHHILESKLGTAFARCRGMQNGAADTLIFVDDDNVLDYEYLSEVVRIKHDWPLMGVWGSGATLPEFEMDPPEHLKELLGHLALRQTTSTCWSNVPSCLASNPWGAGMCVREAVAAEYCRLFKQSSLCIAGRRGKSAVNGAGEDREINFVACKNGYGMGVFPQLRLTHLIPKERVAEKYLLELVERNVISNMLLDFKWGGKVPTRPTLRRLLSPFTQRGLNRQLSFAYLRASREAERIINESRRAF